MIATVKARPSGQTFRRLTFSQRGHFPNTIRFRPVSEVSLSSSGLSLTKGDKQSHFSWAEVKKAAILAEESFKGYGRAASSRFIKRTFTIETFDGDRFVFDVSENFPDFENNDVLLSALREHLVVTETAVKPFKHLLWIAVAIIFLMAGVMLKKLSF